MVWCSPNLTQVFIMLITMLVTTPSLLLLVIVSPLAAQTTTTRTTTTNMMTNNAVRANRTASSIQQSIVLAETTKRQMIGGSVAYLEDASCALTLKDVLLPEQAMRFRASATERPSFGFTESAYWFSFTIVRPPEARQNGTSEQSSPSDVFHDLHDSWLLEVAYSPLDSIEVFHQNSAGVWQRRVFGDHYPFAARAIAHRNFLISLDLSLDSPLDSVSKKRASGSHQYYIRVRTTSSMQVPLEVYRASALYEAELTSALYYGGLYGLLAVMAAYTTFLYLALRRAHYLWYVGYVLAVFLYYAALNGHAYQYVLGASPWWGGYVHPLAFSLSLAGLAGFTRSFLSLDGSHNMIRLYRIGHRDGFAAPAVGSPLMPTLVPPILRRLSLFLQSLVACGIALAIASSVLSYGLSVRIGAALVACTVLVSLGTGLMCWKLGNRTARYFVTAVVIFVIGNLLFVGKTIGLLPVNVFTNHAVELGTAVESFMLAFALADRYRVLRLEKEAAQNDALDVQRRANESLEHNVQQRTEELRQANNEMQRQMHILDEQANEIELANTTLQENNLLLRAMNLEKSEIMGIVAHDLKNPLTTIIMNASMVRNYRERISETQLEGLAERIERTAQRMHDSILKLLDVTALEEGKIQMQLADVSVLPLMQTLIEDYAKRAAAKNIRLNLDLNVDLNLDLNLNLNIPQPSPIIARADAFRLQEVLENLVSNAIKFSPPETQVRLAAASNNTSNGTLIRMSVRDEGPGLSDDDKAKLFGKFTRLSAQPTGGESSTGLGLAIVKKMVEAMHGRVWCESTLGAGATFIIELPAATAESHSEAVP